MIWFENMEKLELFNNPHEGGKGPLSVANSFAVPSKYIKALSLHFFYYNKALNEQWAP